VQKELAQLLTTAEESIQQAAELDALEHLRVQYLGKKGSVTELLKQLKDLSPEERREAGQTLNEAKQRVQTWLGAKRELLKASALAQKLEQEKIDVTLPGRGQVLGSLHPVTQVRQRVETIFTSMGFEVIEGPEIEDEYHNFDALNIPPHHPARAMHDTFYLDNNLLLRTHTSPVQIRAMKNLKPPLRVITPGRVYRCDSDQTHTPMFHQVEGFWVDKHVTMTDLKGVLISFVKTFFESDLSFRFRPSYFPFTEPSAELDIAWPGEEDDRWLEILGCGMVHPNVLRNVGIDPDEYQGFAFGLGLDRLAMLRYGIDDLRMMFENDVRFLEQF